MNPKPSGERLSLPHDPSLNHVTANLTTEPPHDPCLYLSELLSYRQQRSLCTLLLFESQRPRCVRRKLLQSRFAARALPSRIVPTHTFGQIHHVPGSLVKKPTITTSPMQPSRFGDVFSEVLPR
eukprot:2422553-Amphidinium_carterae.1